MERGDRAFKIAKAHRISVVEYQKKVVSLQPHKKSQDFLVQWGSVVLAREAELHKKMQRKAHDADEPQQP